MLVDISTEHPGSASRVITPLDAPFVPDISHISTSPAPMTSGDPSQPLATFILPSPPEPSQQSSSFIPPSPPEPSQQSASRSLSRRLAVPLIVIMLLALIVGGGAWYSKFLSPAHSLGLRQSTSPLVGQATLTATTSGPTQATAGVAPTGVANGHTPVPTTGTPGTSSTPGTSVTPTPSGTPGPSGTPIPTPTQGPGQTPTPAPDCLKGSASNLSFTSVLGLGNPAPQTMTLTNCGGNSANWTASATTNGGGPWLNVNPAGGTIALNGGQNVQIRATSSGLQLGLYSGSITFRKGSATWTVTVSYTIVSL